MTSAIADMSQATLDALRAGVLDAYKNPNNPTGFQRDINLATGLTFYDLQAPAKQIVPIITPLLNMTPRVPGTGDVATHWKAVTALNTANLEGAVPEGVRQARVSTTVVNKQASYATMGLEDQVTWEADWAAQQFEDVRANTAIRLLISTKIAEEQMLLGGDNSLALGTPTTPTVSDNATGGTIATGTVCSVIVVALTLAGLRNSSMAAGVPAAAVSITSPDGTVFTYGGGTSAKSAAGAVTTGGGNTHSIGASVPVVPGAVAYAWYLGTAGNERIAAITNINSVLLTSVPGAGQLASAIAAGDRSTNAYAFDGLLTQAFAGTGATITNLATGSLVTGAGTVLTSNGAAGITEIDTMLRSLWDNQRISPSMMVMNSQELLNINKKVIAASGAPLFRFTGDMNSGIQLTGGNRVIGSYINQFTPEGGALVKPVLHPNMPAGTIMFLTDSLPGYFPNNNLGHLWEMHVQRDYYQIDWPARTRAYEMGVYAREAVAHYYPASMGILTNIANG